VSSQRTVRPEWTGLVDDAAVFPPGNAELAEAVSAYLARRSEEDWAAFVGPLVVGDRALPALADLVPPDADPLPVTVVVSGGAGGLGPLPRWFAGERLRLAGIEIALRDLDDLPGSARRVVAAAQQASYDLPEEVPVYVELPQLGAAGAPAQPGTGWLGALDEVAMADLRGKLRTGGLEAHLFPSEEGLAAAIEALLDRELAFKCTAGLHRAVRHRADDTGFEHHGFLNVLLATRASLDGEDAVAALAERDPEAVAGRVRGLGDAAARTRRWFTSFGCCGVADPWSDLVRLALV
jgi:hypothetical protein